MQHSIVAALRHHQLDNLTDGIIRREVSRLARPINAVALSSSLHAIVDRVLIVFADSVLPWLGKAKAKASLGNQRPCCLIFQ